MRLLAKSSRDRVSSLGETGLIAAIRRWLGGASPAPPFGIGDDCAVFGASGRRRQLLTVDPVVYGVHIDDRVSPREAGSKLLKRNLSDVAAMGGRPRAAVVALALDGRVAVDWIGEFYRGIARESRRHAVPIVGGDIATLPGGALVATLTLVGEAPGRVLTRKGSRAGDGIYVTGLLGRSLQTGHHHRFQPRLAQGQWLARRSAVRAMMDLSDGLAKDIGALASPGIRPCLSPSLLPRRAGATLREALCDGEDYELVFSLSAGADAGAFERNWRRAFPRIRLTRIGSFVARGNPSAPDEIDPDQYLGYEHFKST
jgi:thiamine-monophosphate kinase